MCANRSRWRTRAIALGAHRRAKYRELSGHEEGTSGGGNREVALAPTHKSHLDSCVNKANPVRVTDLRHLRGRFPCRLLAWGVCARLHSRLCIRILYILPFPLRVLVSRADSFCPFPPLHLIGSRSLLGDGPEITCQRRDSTFD